MSYDLSPWLSVENELLRCEGEAGRLVRKGSQLVIQARNEKALPQGVKAEVEQNPGVEDNLKNCQGDLLMEGERGEGDLHIPWLSHHIDMGKNSTEDMGGGFYFGHTEFDMHTGCPSGISARHLDR